MSKELFKNETLAEKFINKGKWLYIFSLLMAPTGYIIKLLISNDLSVAEVGVIYSIIWFVTILSNYNDLGFTESLKYFLPKFWINKKYDEFKTSLYLALWIQTITAILIAIWLWFGADWLANNYFHSPLASQVLKIFSLWFVIFNIFRTFNTIYQSFQDTFSFKFIDFVRMWSIVIFVTIIFFANKWSVLNYSLAWFWGTLIGLLVSGIIFVKKYYFILKKWKFSPKKQLIKQIFSYAIWVLLATQAWILLWSIDQQMVIYFLWPEPAWYYTNYLSLLTIYSILLGPLFGFLFPVTTELIEKKEKWKLSIMINMFLKYFWVFGILWWSFLFVFGPLIAFVLFWKKFVFSGELLQIGGLFVFLNILNAILFSILAGLGKIKQRAKILWFGALVNFVLNLILLNTIWIIWAVISTIIGWFIMLILLIKEVLKEWIQIKIDWKFIVKNLALGIIFGLTGYLALQNYPFQHRLTGLWLIFGVWLVYWIVILLVNWKEVRLFLNQVRSIKWK